jgi:hypothetical protein
MLPLVTPAAPAPIPTLLSEAAGVNVDVESMTFLRICHAYKAITLLIL